MTMGILTDINGVVPQRAIRYLETMPYFVSYTKAAVNFDTVDSAVIATPAQFRGKPMSVELWDNTESVVATTQPRVDIGDGSDIDEFALTDDIADGTAAQTFSVADGTLNVGDQEIIEPGDQVTITYTAGITAPAGIYNVTTTFLYFK